MAGHTPTPKDTPDAVEPGPGPSRLLRLTLTNFRGFEHLDLKLPEDGPAVLIGVNGSGKSSVLDAITMHLLTFARIVAPVRRPTPPIAADDLRLDAERAEVAAVFRLGAEEQTFEIKATAAPPGANREDIFGELAGVGDAARRLGETLRRAEGASIPALGRYPATRGLGASVRPVVEGSSGGRATRQLDAYEGAFLGGLGPFQDLVRWFRGAEDIENAERLRRDNAYRHPPLQAVRTALEKFLGDLGSARFSNLLVERFDPDELVDGLPRPAELTLEKDGARFNLKQLSEGERNTFLLVSDVARRLATANPGLADPLQGEGIILIDEIELHLHPSWERGILPALCATFPRVQFIVTTHSSQVLSRVKREHVFTLENFAVLPATPHTYGRDANAILGEVMGVPERPREIEEKIRQASILIDEEKLDEAKVAVAELAGILGEQDAEVVGLRTLLRFMGKPVRG